MPDADPFYAEPSPMPDLPPGTILNSRSVTFAPIEGASMSNDAWQLQFISRDTGGNAIAAIATVVKPTQPHAGGPVLLSYQYAEDSLGSACAPSHMVTGEQQNHWASVTDGPLPLSGLLQGWTLVYPDHEGPYSAYAAGRLSGQITLDGIRAALSFKPLALSARTPVGVWGYSGGAIPTAWAASLHAAYAPGLNIVAVASGGTPASPIATARNIDTNADANAKYFPLILSALEGINRAYPQMITPILNDSGRAAFDAMKDGCFGGTSRGAAEPAGTTSDYTMPNPYDQPSVAGNARLITLPLANNDPIADVFVYHSQVDELEPIAETDAMVADWCASGSHVAYYRATTGNHGETQVTGGRYAMAYLASRFNGSPATATPPGTEICN